MVVGVWGPYNEDDKGALPLSCPKYGNYSLITNTTDFVLLKMCCNQALSKLLVHFIPFIPKFPHRVGWTRMDIPYACKCCARGRHQQSRTRVAAAGARVVVAGAGWRRDFLDEEANVRIYVRYHTVPYEFGHRHCSALVQQVPNSYAY